MKCWCHTCNPIDWTKPETVFMRLCPECGNKRCPKATDHNNACTHSNDPGQIGSVYGIMADPWDEWKPSKDIS